MTGPCDLCPAITDLTLCPCGLWICDECKVDRGPEYDTICRECAESQAVDVMDKREVRNM